MRIVIYILMVLCALLVVLCYSLCVIASEADERAEQFYKEWRRRAMSDLINGREMLNRYQANLCYGIACKDCSMSTEDGGCKVEEWIDKFPSADRPQGEWIYGEHDVAMCDGYRCDRCGFFVPWDYEHKFIDFINDYHFCPNCGSKMRGEHDD